MTFLTIREAASRTGHSTHKIRRLIKAISEQPNDVDRAEIEPSSADVARLNSEGVQFTWRITEELVRRRLGNASSNASDLHAGRGGESAATLSLLERAITQFAEQLKVKDEQLKVKDQQISSLNERLRESNLLMASLQQQLPKAKNGSVMLNAEKTKVGSASVERKRRSWLSNLFS
jgi:chromosome segregation ATPase